MFNRLKALFKRPDIDSIKRTQEAQNAQLIALARLSFIKPETLLREALNQKANTEYLIELIKLQDRLMERLKR